MNNRKLTGYLTIIIFTTVTGLLFCLNIPQDDIGSDSEYKIASSEALSDDTQGSPESELQTVTDIVLDTEIVSGSVTGSSESANETDGGIYVYVCGSVRKPGVYLLDSDSRIFEAIEAAGGTTKNACPEQLNLAEPVYDGMRIYVPSKDDTVDAGITQSLASSAGSSSVSGSALININSADLQQLQTLPGIGSSRASDIISYRETNGSFASIDELMNVPGIKEGIYNGLKNLITVR